MLVPHDYQDKEICYVFVSNSKLSLGIGKETIFGSPDCLNLFWKYSFKFGPLVDV